MGEVSAEQMRLGGACVWARRPGPGGAGECGRGSPGMGAPAPVTLSDLIWWTGCREPLPSGPQTQQSPYPSNRLRYKERERERERERDKSNEGDRLPALLPLLFKHTHTHTHTPKE